MKEIIAEFARNETIRQLSAAAKTAWIHERSRLYRHRPNISPVTAAVSVKPGKYAPVGNASEPMKSPSAETSAAQAGAVEHRAQRYRGKAESDFHKRGVEREHPREQHIRREQYRRDGELTCSYLHYYNTTFP